MLLSRVSHSASVYVPSCVLVLLFFFFFNDTATTEIYTLPYTTLFRSVMLILIYRTDLDVAGVFTTSAVLSDRKSTRLNSSHRCISYAVFCLKNKTQRTIVQSLTGGVLPGMRFLSHSVF